jgi:omega-amidase
MCKTKVALCQMKVGLNKQDNLDKAVRMIEQAADQGAEMVMLPEMFNCPYHHQYFKPFAEALPGGESENALSAVATRKEIFLIGGSIPELGAKSEIYNTSLIFDSSGRVIGKHRKMHLFDVQIKGGIQYQESNTITAGKQITLADTPWGKIGVMVCYDIRFPELTRLMAMSGARIIFVPAAFNLTTGPAHWELLFRSRAIDNQVFMLGCSPARDLKSPYIAYGHSLVTNPWGKVIGELEEEEEILIVELDLAEIDEIRRSLPTWQHRRDDVYRLSEISSAPADKGEA